MNVRPVVMMPGYVDEQRKPLLDRHLQVGDNGSHLFVVHDPRSVVNAHGFVHMVALLLQDCRQHLARVCLIINKEYLFYRLPLP
jgi:hypothetical protein